jgi:predicted ATP-dependent serine protease
MRTVSGITVMEQRKDIEWLWDPYLPIGSISLLAAKGGVGKSGFALWLAGNLIKHRQINVLYIDLEQTLGHFKERMTSWGMGDVAQQLFFIVEDDPNVGIESSKVKVSEIAAEATKINAKLIIIDSMSSYYANYEIENRKGAVQLLTELRGAAVRAGASVLLIAHTTKDTIESSGYVSIDKITGSGAVSDFARSVIFLTQDENDVSKKTLHHIKSNFKERSPNYEFILNADGLCNMQVQQEQKQLVINSQQTKGERYLAIATLAAIDGKDKSGIRAAVKEAGGNETDATRAWNELIKQGTINDVN